MYYTYMLRCSDNSTPEEVEERDILRRSYIAAVRANLVGQLENTYIVEPDGTKHRLTHKDN